MRQVSGVILYSAGRMFRFSSATQAAAIASVVSFRLNRSMTDGCTNLVSAGVQPTGHARPLPRLPVTPQESLRSSCARSDLSGGT